MNPKNIFLETARSESHICRTPPQLSQADYSKRKLYVCAAALNINKPGKHSIVSAQLKEPRQKDIQFDHISNSYSCYYSDASSLARFVIIATVKINFVKWWLGWGMIGLDMGPSHLGEPLMSSWKVSHYGGAHKSLIATTFTMTNCRQIHQHALSKELKRFATKLKCIFEKINFHRHTVLLTTIFHQLINDFSFFFFLIQRKWRALLKLFTHSEN